MPDPAVAKLQALVRIPTTNGTKTVGGAIASAVFAIALASTGSIEEVAEAQAPLSGYLTVWAVCSAAALLAAVALLAGAPSRTGRFGPSPKLTAMKHRPPDRDPSATSAPRSPPRPLACRTRRS